VKLCCTAKISGIRPSEQWNFLLALKLSTFLNLTSFILQIMKYWTVEGGCPFILAFICTVLSWELALNYTWGVKYSAFLTGLLNYETFNKVRSFTLKFKSETGFILVSQRGNILKRPWEKTGEVPVVLLEAGDQTVIFVVPLGDTVCPRFFWLTLKWADCSHVQERVEQGLEQDGQKKEGRAGNARFHFWLQVVLGHGSWGQLRVWGFSPPFL